MAVSNYSKDLFKQVQELMVLCDNLSHEVKNVKKDTEKVYKAEIKKLKSEHKIEIEKLNNEIRELKTENTKLKNEVDRLKSQLNKDSDNSSNPPSSDIKPNKKKISNNRVKTDKKIGGQLGHKGTNLSKKYVEENIKNNNFNHIVKHVGNISDKYVSKYILDICVEVNATEYRFYANEKGKIIIPKEFHTDVQYGEELKTLCTVLNVNDIVAIDRLTDFVNHLTHGKIKMSNGTIINNTKKLSQILTKKLDIYKEKILNSKKIYTDATTSRCDNSNVCVRNYSTDEYTLLKATKTKSKKDIEETDIITNYTGTLIHDHETVIYNYGSDHVECNVHVTRYLKGNHENTKHEWDNEMITLLIEANNEKKELLNNGINEMSKEKIRYYFERYDEILKKGKAENKKEKSTYYQSEEKKLINRLEKYKNNHLKFIEDFEMPFDNNISERELRHVKGKQKISGTFKSLENLQDYLNIKSFIITCIKQSKDFYKEIKEYFKISPVTI